MCDALTPCLRNANRLCSATCTESQILTWNLWRNDLLERKPSAEAYLPVRPPVEPGRGAQQVRSPTALWERSFQNINITANPTGGGVEGGAQGPSGGAHGSFRQATRRRRRSGGPELLLKRREDVHLRREASALAPEELWDGRSCKCGKSDEVKKVGTVSGIICLSTAQT